MGCCVSSPGGASEPPVDALANSSSRAIVHPQAQSVENHRPSISSHSNHPPHPRHRSGNSSQPLAHHYNKNLKPLVWTSEDHIWTRREIDAERVAFFDTRTDGQPVIWQTIHAILSILWSGGDGEPDGGIATAQEMLNGAAITNPSGNMTKGLYDDKGWYYALPRHIIADPTNLVEDDTDIDAEAAKDDAEDKGSEEADEETLRRREIKGKAVVNPNDMLTLKARRSDGVPHDLVINVSKEDTVRVVARRLFVEAGLQPAQRMRIGFLGKIMDEKRSLEDQGWREGFVVSAYISDTA